MGPPAGSPELSLIAFSDGSGPRALGLMAAGW